MPASLVADFSSNPGGLEDQRALQLALELSMMGLNPAPEEENGYHHPQHQNGVNSSPTFDGLDEAARSKRGANMTECVPVPSSEHVAEIVGRQGEENGMFLEHYLCCMLVCICFAGYLNHRWIGAEMTQFCMFMQRNGRGSQCGRSTAAHFDFLHSKQTATM